MNQNRRSWLKQSAAVATTAAGLGAGLGIGHALLANRPNRYPVNSGHYGPHGTRLIRPPGAVSEPAFLAGCIRCYRCQDACEPGAIQFFSEAAGRHYHTPYVDPAIKACTVCMKCTTVCPTGVLQPLVVEQRADVRMATVTLDPDRCLSYKAEARYDQRAARWEVKLPPSLETEPPTIGTDADLKRRGACGECYTVCPVRERAIQQKPGSFLSPLVFAEHCIGCGLCEEICRQIVHGEPAIRVLATRGEIG